MTQGVTVIPGEVNPAVPRSINPAMSAVSVDEPVTIAILGASGDLTLRKLVPALYALYAQGLFRKRLAIMGFARHRYGDAEFRERVREAIKSFGRLSSEDGKLDEFVRLIRYHRGDLDDIESFQALKTRLGDSERFPGNRVFYLAIAPERFLPAIATLDSSGLIGPAHEKPWTRVVIEKPFGRDLDSARNLNWGILTHLDESQIFRIDHYLGKETVQNILGFRLANSIFEPVFTRHHVDHIEISASETVGMESGRGAYYDSAGALRDMVQNHLLQLLCLVAMEPPANLTANAIHDAKVQLLQSVVPPAPHEMRSRAIRAQYIAGLENGRPVPAYADEDRVAPGSRTESYCALRLGVENWRWAGVPVFLRTGKRMKRRLTEIVIQFKQPPLQLFQTVECEGDVCDLTRSRPNTLVFRIQPDEGISLLFSAKRPSMQLVVESVAMNFSYQQTWKHPLPEAYERLLLDVVRGDSSLFTRSDQVEAAWRVVDPILKVWESQPDIPIYTYAAGSWGPAAADDLIRQEGRAWWDND